MDRPGAARLWPEDPAANNSLFSPFLKNGAVIELWMGGEHSENQGQTAKGMWGKVLLLTRGDLMQ